MQYRKMNTENGCKQLQIIMITTVNIMNEPRAKVHSYLI